MYTKTKPVKVWHIILFSLIIIFALSLKLYGFYWPKVQVQVGSQDLTVLLAKGSRHLHQGLTGRKDLGKYQGVLFVFPDRGQHTMVMRDINFAIDIIWIDNYKIVDMALNLQAEPDDLASRLEPYFSRASSDMVLEVSAGFAVKNKLKIGDMVKISN
ncbi:MAG: DUF192 domain-containing protein [bacterium]